jgi:hypothetical protein
VLDVSIGTVKSRILRGRRALKELLEPELGASHSEARQGGMMGRELAGGER